MSWLKAILIALDQLLNALLGSWPDETLSSRCWRWEQAGVRSWPRKVLDGVALALGDQNHCFESYASERLGRQLPPELRPCKTTIKEA